MPELATPQTCTGCAACDNICPHSAITIKSDSEGFLMPVVSPDKCVECKLCEKACPIVNGKDLKHKHKDYVYAFWDNATRTKSSSGGAFSAVARQIIDRGGVVYGAAWLDNLQLCHIRCTDHQSLAAFRGSKYLQSAIGDTFRQVRSDLREGRMVLFTGTPCQVAGLRSFLFKPFENLVTIDIVCHGVPSNVLFGNYIAKLKESGSRYRDITGFQFRNLTRWGFALAAITKNHKRIPVTGVDNLYMEAFNKASTFRKSCYECRFNGTTRVGDITIADFWGLGRQGTPFNHDVSEGVSLVMANTPGGEELILGAKDCFIEKRSLEEAIKFNHNLVGSSRRPANRDGVIESFNNPDLSLKEINGRFHITPSGASATLKNLLIRSGLFWTAKSILNKLRKL
ncbi:MAG: Coenzyme F420 hydrogenase/dehydrogenase, beta subunit C-terminal domain [Muribaculaceae bacterium]|nr:Coenzyme F420 hydrogenase/dehydrogenase, beta subunit C-terminal domain [Muribaculaceae bacterium]